MNVLIADDDRIVLEMLERQLTAWGYRVVTASDGVDAWRRYQRDSFQFVISDWLMPHMDGPRLLTNIRSSQTSPYVYCILLTVKSQLDDLIMGMDAGADDFLTKPFDPNELRVRLGAGRRVIELERRLSNANDRMKRELREAAKIQRSLLPRTLDGMKRSRFAWSYRPCGELGGDILNIVPLGNDQVAFYLLDVAGHGVPAALLSVAISRVLTTTTGASSIVRERDEVGPSYRVVPPSEVLSRLNSMFLDIGNERFFTMMYGVWDLNTYQLCYASGGHNPAILLRSDGAVRTLASTGTVIGMIPDAAFTQLKITMNPQDRLLLYSDGITEAVNSEEEMFGLQRLTSFAKLAATVPIQDMLDNLVRQVEEWCQPQELKDDISCLLAEAT